MLKCTHLCHAQRFYVSAVGVKDDVFDVGDGDVVSVEFGVHFPLAVLKRKHLLVREGRFGALGKHRLDGKFATGAFTQLFFVHKPTAQPRGGAVPGFRFAQRSS